MATPSRMVDLKCPRCQHHQWVIDHDFRGSELLGQRELSYNERTYQCPACHEASTGYRVLQRSPPEFFLQPHPMYPMATREFARWLVVFRAHFPSHKKLRMVGVSWYPGKGDDRQERKLRDARQISTVHGYHLSLSNDSPDDERIRVCVQANGEAHFWCGSEIELDRCYFGFDQAEIETIRAILAARASDIRRAWQRFSEEATKAREKWLPELGPVSANPLAGPNGTMRRNYPAWISLSALVVGVVLPVGIGLLFPDNVEAFGRRQGPGMLALIILWVGGWSLIGFLSGTVGVFLSFRGFGGRGIAFVGVLGNLFFMGAQLANIGLF